MSIKNNTTDLRALLEVANNLPEAITPETPIISVDSSGLITAEANDLSATQQLAFQAAKTITPSTASQIAVSSGYYTGGNITVAAIPSQYVVPSGTLTISANGTHDVKNYASAVVNVESSGSGEAEDAIISGTISEVYVNDRVTNIDIYTFYHRESLPAVSFPNVTTIGSFAFCNCYSLTTVSFPNATNVCYNAFYNCYSLNGISFPNVTSIGSSAFYRCSRIITAIFPEVTGQIGDQTFYGCSGLTTVSFPSVTSIGSSAFAYCSSLTTVSFPSVTSIGSSAFQNCTKLMSAFFPSCASIYKNAFYSCGSLTTVSFPLCTSIGSNAFYSCSRLTSVPFPACARIDSQAFYGCSSLATASFGACSYIASSAFYKCYRLSSLTLGASTVCSLPYSNAFSSTPYAGYSTYFSGTPYIYVPSSLVSSYKTATNWTYFSSYFSAIGGADSGDSGSGELISFTIGSASYQAEDGMTWAEWVGSEYNTDGFTVFGSYIHDYEDTPVTYDGMNYVNKTDVIVANTSYQYM